MTTLRRALGLGFAFGLAAANLELGLNLLTTVMRRMGPGLLFSVEKAALMLGLGLLLGLAAAPLLRLRFGRAWHIGAVALSWYALERWVAIDAPLFGMLQIVPPAGGALLIGLGCWLTRWRASLPWAIGAVGLVAALLMPGIYLDATTPPQPERAELPPPRDSAPAVVLVVLDTVRAENVSTYGYHRKTAPAIDALAREGALFLDATSPSTWSLPSHASLFSGRYPSSHGAHAEHRFLDDRYPTLAQVLEANGYETYCITANPWISDGLGLTRGFGWQDESLHNQGGAGIGFSFIHRLLDRLGLLEADKGGHLVAASFERWASERPAETERPAFVFLNFIEAHFPYHQLPHDYLWMFNDLPYGELRQISLDLLAAQFGGASQPIEKVGEPTRAMYDGGVAYTSELLSRVVEALRARGSLDDTVLVVLADHGEILGERADFFGHGPSLYQEVVGVPLLVRYPPRIPAGVRVELAVSTLAAFATILDLADIEPPPTLQVASLAPLARGESGSNGGPILSELHDRSQMGADRELSDPQMKPGRRYRLLREGSLKLVAVSDGTHLLYDLAADPDESRDLSSERPADLARMVSRLEDVQSSLGLPALDAPLATGEDAPALDAATQEQLRALGYIE